MARMAVIGITSLFGVTIREVGRPSSRYPATAQVRFARSFVRRRVLLEAHPCPVGSLPLAVVYPLAADWR